MIHFTTNWSLGAPESLVKWLKTLSREPEPAKSPCRVSLILSSQSRFKIIHRIQVERYFRLIAKNVSENPYRVYSPCNISWDMSK